MTRRTRSRLVTYLTGLVLTIALAGAVLWFRQRRLEGVTTAYYTPATGAATWEGDWAFSDRGADPSEASAERVIIPFTGTDLALRVRRGDYRAYFFVTVDGRPANRLPRDPRGAYLVLTSPELTPEIVTIPVASDLEDTAHVAEIAAERGWDQWPLVGWAVGRRPDTRAYDWLLAALGMAGLACLAAVIALLVRARRFLGGLATSLRWAPAPPALWPALAGSPSASLSALIAAAASAGLFYFSPYLALTIVAGVALAAVVVLRLDIGLALVAGMAPFYLKPRPIGGKAFSMVEITVLLCALSWAIRQIVSQIRQRHMRTNATIYSTGWVNGIPLRGCASGVDLAVLLFVLVSVASFFVADYQHVALRELRVLIAEPALFYLMLRTTKIDLKATWRIVDLFVLGAVAVAVIGLVQYGLGVNIITAEGGFRRLHSVYGSPNSVGLYLGRVLPVLAAVALLGGCVRRRAAYGLAALPVAAAIWLSFSKGTLLIGVPASLLAVGILAGGRWLAAALIAAGSAAAAAVPLLRTPRFASLLDTRTGTTFFRLQLWQSAWAMFRDHPWLGVGPDNFLYRFRGRYIRPAAWQEPHISQAHNIILDYATRAGIAGLAAGTWLQVAFWRLALPLRVLRDRDRRALALGLMGAMVNFLAHGMVDASYYLVDLAFALFVILGLVQLLARSEPNEHEA